MPESKFARQLDTTPDINPVYDQIFGVSLSGHIPDSSTKAKIKNILMVFVPAFVLLD